MSETLAAQLKKTALAAKTAAENIDIKQKKAMIVNDCKRKSGVGGTSDTPMKSCLKVPKSDSERAFVELARMLEADGFVVTRDTFWDGIKVSWE